MENTGKTTRLMSIDALRGFDMFWILYPTYPVFHALLVALGLKGCWLDLQMDHLPWIGFTFYDTIYPLFLFLGGVSFPFSYASARERGMSGRAIGWKIVRRMIVLVLLGSTISGSLRLDFEKLTLCSVIGRIGITCGIASFAYMLFGLRLRIAICAGILLLYWVLPFFTGCPGVPPGTLPYAEKTACVYVWLDTHFFPRPLFGAGFTGLFPMISTAMLGMFAGDWLRNGKEHGTFKVRGLLIGALGCTLLGVLMATAFGKWSAPVIKPIWSSSYAMVTAGYSLAMLALFYWIIDVRRWSGWSFAFRVIGMNSVFAYLASRTIIFPWQFTMTFLFGGIMARCPTPEWGAFVGQALYMVAYWLLLYLMYRKKIFLKAG